MQFQLLRFVSALILRYPWYYSWMNNLIFLFNLVFLLLLMYYGFVTYWQCYQLNGKRYVVGEKWSAFHVCARPSELVIDSSLKTVCYADLSRTMKIKDLLCIQASQWIQIVHKHTPTSKCASKFLLHASQTDRMRPFEICERRTYMIHNDGLDWLRVTMNLCLAFHAMLYAISVHTYAEFCKNPYFFVYSTRGSFTLKMTKVVLTVKKPTKSIESKKNSSISEWNV